MDKLVFLIVDGLGDDKIKNLNNKTPLEYANKPNINMFLRHSAYAFPKVLDGLAPESDAGVVANLGYDPKKVLTGRGWLECSGLGMSIDDGDLCVRVNVGEAKNGRLISVRTYLSDEEFKKLEDEINSKVKIDSRFEFKRGPGYRAGLVIKEGAKKFSQFVSNSQPGYTVKFYGQMKLGFASSDKSTKIARIKALDKDATYTAAILNDFADKANAVLSESEVSRSRKTAGLPVPNTILLRDGAIHPPPMADIEKRYGRAWGAIVGMPLEKGIAKAAGMHIIHTNEIKDLETDLQEKAETLTENIKRFDALYVHVKQTDSASHLGKCAEKVKIIETIDRTIIKAVAENISIDRGDTFVLTADHATSCILKRHTSARIPVLIANRRFGAQSGFGENNCMRNHIQRIRKAVDIMPFVEAL